MTSTAIQRNFIKVPKYISFALFVTLYLGYWILIPWKINLFVIFLGSVAWGIVSFAIMDKLADYLTRTRFEYWASEIHGVHPDDFDEFLENLEPEELEKMVAMDFEGWQESWDEES